MPLRPVTVALTGAALVLVSATVGHAAANDRFTYAPAQPNLCRNIANAVHVHPVPYTVRVPRIRGTRDFTADANGYSLRTCDWKAVVGNVYYTCPRGQGGRWKIAITGSAELGDRTKSRVVSPIACTGTWLKVPYRFYGRSSVHAHLWAPTDSSTLTGFVLKVERPTRAY